MASHWSELLAGPQEREAEREAMTGYRSPQGPKTLNALRQYGEFLKDHWSTILQDPAQGFSNALANTYSFYPSDKGVNALAQYLQTGQVPADLPQLDTGTTAAESMDFVFPIANKLAMPLMTAYHGSPHKWSKVDLSKVGTGEGAAAYGHGFYAAENPGTALSYKEALSRHLDSKLSGGGEAVDIPQWLASKIEREGIDSAISEWKKRIGEMESKLTTSNQPWIIEGNLSRFRKNLDLMEKIKASGSIATETPGHLYKLDISDEAIDRMLDWDKPLSEQSEYVRNILEKRFDTDYGPLGRLNASGKRIGSGQSIYDLIQNYYVGHNKNTKQSASEYLNSLGIPGIKYLDQGSRQAGEGTRNFVVFDEDIVKVLERNGEKIDALPMDEASRMQRARNMGFDVDTPLYHGTKKDFSKFDPNLIGSGTDEGWLGKGFNFTPYPDVAEAYGNYIMPVYVRMKNPFRFPEDINPIKFVNEKGGSEGFTKWLKENGYDGVISDRVLHQTVVTDPKNIRSRFAAFDPSKKDSANILAGGAAAAAGLTHWSQILNEEDNQNALR